MIEKIQALCSPATHHYQLHEDCHIKTVAAASDTSTVNTGKGDSALWESRRSYQSKYQFSLKMSGHSSFCRENSTDDGTNHFLANF